MNRRTGANFAVLLGVCLLLGSTAAAQKLKFNWKREFAKNVSWYVRTSPGILLVRASKSLAALDSKDGRQLWAIRDLGIGSPIFGDMPDALERGRNVLEVPGMGILLINAAELPSGAERRLIALNLMTGEKLWDTNPVDQLMTAIPLYESGQMVVVSRRTQKKILVTEAAAAAASQVPFLFASGAFPYPYRFEMERLDLATGKVIWNEEYPRTFTPGTTRVSVFGDHLYIYFGNRFLGCVDLGNGKPLWDDGAKPLWSGSLPLPLQMADGRLIYASGEVQAIDPQTQATAWTVKDIGRITGIFAHDGLVVAIGEKRMTGVDSAGGAERWRIKTYGHTTNLVWEKESDTLLYMDWKGFHRVERKTGKSLLEAKLRTDHPPYYLRMAGPNAVVGIGYRETDAYDTKSGKLLFSEAKLNGMFRALAVMDNWPLPDDGQGLVQMTAPPTGDEWEKIRRRTLLTDEAIQKFQEATGSDDGFFDVYQTQPEKGERKIWWVDGQTNRQMVVRPAAKQNDVNRPEGNLFAVDGKLLWAATIEVN